MLSSDNLLHMNGSQTTDDFSDDIDHHFSPIPDPRVQVRYHCHYWHQSCHTFSLLPIVTLYMERPATHHKLHSSSPPMLSSDNLLHMNGSQTTDDFSDDIDHHFSPIPDPRVQIELENLNTSTDLINKLEVELNESRTHFHLLLSDSSQKISELAKKLGSCVERVKPYYEARVRAKELRVETQRAALRFERATSSHIVAKEMVRLAEEGLQKEGTVLDDSWQEVLNHSTSRVNDCERERISEQLLHQKVSQDYNNSEQLVLQLHKQLKRSINKARYACIPN
ncbi:unnamed protein product, partial [Medioppia subpectinata]